VLRHIIKDFVNNLKNNQKVLNKINFEANENPNFLVVLEKILFLNRSQK